MSVGVQLRFCDVLELMLHDLLNIKYFFPWKFNKIKIKNLKNIGESE